MSARSASSAVSPRAAKQGPNPPDQTHVRQISRSSADRLLETTYSNSPGDTTSSSSTVRERPASRLRAERRRWTVTVNESFARDEVLLNLDLVGDDIGPGRLVAIDVVKADADKPAQNPHHKQQHLQERKDGSCAGCAERRYICVAKDMPRELKARYPTVEVYVAKPIADAFGMRKGTQVTLTPIDANNPAVEASHIELCFKDQYLSRADMWRMAVGELAQRTVYKGQMILFLGTVKAQVTAVYVDGRKVQSAFFGRDTKPIFRSESARYVLFIQMAREMWDFDQDGSGEIMFNKVVNGFLPALFKKWAAMKVKHLVTIVMFARVEYDMGLSTELANAAVHHDYFTGVQASGDRHPYKDFYRVVVSEMASGEWTKILHQLKREFNHLRKDISTDHQKAMASSTSPQDSGEPELLLNRIKAEPSRAIHGNFLEAINMASSMYAHDYIDRDLTRTGVSVVVISPGPGVFEVEYDALRRTTEALVGNGIGIDLICIPKVPLHSVPLFRYRNPHHLSGRARRKSKADFSHGSTPKQTGFASGSYSSLAGSYSPSKRMDGARPGEPSGPASSQEEWVSAIPQWLHVSYWTGASEEELSYQGIALSVSDAMQTHTGDDFPIRCRMYDLQMRSVMETNEIETKPLHTDPDFPLSAVLATQASKPHYDLEGNVIVKNMRVPETLFDHVFGFQRFAPDRHSKPGERSLWKQLQEYDERRARLPSRRSSSHPRHGRDQDETPRRQVLEDATALFGTSVTESRPSSALQQTILETYSYYRPGSERQGVLSSSRRSISVKPNKPSSSKAPSSPVKPPKFMRHISLGDRGFGIAAPKPATAEVSMESVGASKSVTASRSSQDLSVTPARRTGERPSSSHRMTVGTPTPIQSQAALSPFSLTAGPHFPADLPGTPTRPVAIRNQQLASGPSASMLSGSILATTLRPEPVGQDRDIKYSNAIRAEDAKKLYNSKLLAGAIPELPSTLSPETALSPWLTVLNPSNPDTNDVDMAMLYSRWQHVFPRPQEMRIMKWKSLCSPAAVPLTTEYFPSKAQFEAEYERQPYNVSQNLDDELLEEPRSRDELLRELVSLRFCQGFQIVVGPAVARAFGQKQVRVADIFSRDHMMEDGTSIFMSAGNTIHQLSCVNGSEVEVNIFVRKPTDSFQQTCGGPQLYKPAIRTLLDSGYQTSEFDLVTPKAERNWNYIDASVAGHNDELTEHLRFWRARFVLIPMTGRRSSIPGTGGGDNEEEIRIEGIRKLAQIWQRHRYIPPSERRLQGPGTRAKKGMNPFDIVYKTEDASVVIAAELETLPLLEGLDRRGQLVRSGERFSKKNLNLAALAEAIQQPVEEGGVRMQNRRWHFRLHYNCFIGSDMTSWLLDNFEDLEDREEAEALGNRLMVSDDKEKEGKKEGGGLFVHVEKRHPFRDGQYFYQISSEYAKPHPPGWFNSKRGQGSVPSTPLGEQPPRETRPSFSRPTSIHEESSPTSGSTTPTATPAPTGKKPRVMLSRVIKYDVDHRRRSYRPEVVELHYDRLHNPDNCYHFRVDWMNVTAKLVEDAIESWSREAAQYGLRVVEVPIAEACAISAVNPFRRPYVIKLAVPPPDQSPITYYDPNSFTPQAHPGRHFYQKAILRKFDFVLDMEAASNFPSDVDVSYSWGKPDFKYTQYIHRSGSLLAEITDEGHILLLANRLYSSRAAAVREREMQKELRGEQQQQGAGGGGSVGSGTPGLGSGNRVITPGSYTPYGISNNPISSSVVRDPTPVSSPALKPTSGSSLLSPVVRPALSAAAGGTPGSASSGTPGQGQPKFPPTQSGPAAASAAGGTTTATTTITTTTAQEPEWIKDELEAFCRDAEALEAFYKELRTAAPATTSAGGAAMTPAFAAADVNSASAAGIAGAVPEGSIPVLGLPPGVLAPVSAASPLVSASGSGPVVAAGAVDSGSPAATAASTAAAAPAAGVGAGETQNQGVAAGTGPRAASPGLALRSASQLLRRGSLQYEGFLGGLRSVAGGQEKERERD
ncbi:d29bd432-270a-490a-aade-3e62068e6c94 [Thermothielavioides terrestris]|uniref:Vacuolar membrane-associated protein IML1 n=1 Tax=Thermothielavioides terrestris TaxID=2587410 RepID=A0A446BBT9_9PEZI|nr:d29bd432-270a-490a-aade-3e62068e6c94 [Thermothielavioides terrestris]